ncbi:MAG: IS4 family transposase [Mogibacterium sp.]|nr:IS4 family transposase [Mogibacterium sp.]
MIHSEQFTDMCRGNRANVFVRNRKMPVSDLVFSMINRKGLTLKMELRGYMNISHPGTQISKPGYLKQRMKLNPEAIKYLYQFHNRNFYKDPEAELYTFNGYLVLAADGSNVNIPTTPETLEVFGSSSRKGTKRQAALGLACLYDALNRMIIDSTINRVKFNEMAIAEEQLSHVSETIGDLPFLVTLDRGYPSIPAFMRMIDSDIKFVARLKKVDFRQEQLAMDSDDEDVEIVLTTSRRSNHMGTVNEDIMLSRNSFTIRLVRVWLDKDAGTYETLATNLPREEFPADCFGELYRLRWRIETAYETIKDHLQMENFTGTKPILLAQDIYSTIYVSNVAEDIARDIEQEQADHLQNDYKHRMAVNRSLCIGLLKSDLIYIILEDDPDIKSELMQRLYDEISENIVPVRPDRHYERNNSLLHAKYSNTHKRSF